MPTPQEYQAEDEAFHEGWAAQQAQKAQETAQAGQPQTFLQKWTAPVGRVTTQILDSAVSGAQLIYDTPGMKKARDVAAGAITGATNIADTVVKGANKAAELLQPAAEAQRDLGMGAAPQPVIPEPIWDHAKQHIMDFRDAVQVQDPTLSDNLTQSVAQLAIPFAGYSRALSGLHWVAQAATAGALTDATALGPHDARMADMLALGRHTEGKFGEVLRTLAPDGSALNAYINYLHDRTNETEAEGRFKNVLDGFGVNLVATPLLHSVGMLLKQGTAGLRYMVDNGVPSSGGLVPPQMQRGGPAAARQAMANPSEAIATEQARRDMEAAAANPNGKRPPLNQSGIDPAQALYEDTVKQDMLRGNAQKSGAAGLPLEDIGSSQKRVGTPNALEAVRSKLAEVNATGEEHPLHDFVSHLADNLDDKTPENAFYKNIFQGLKEMNLKTKVVSNETHPHSAVENARGNYNYAVDTMATWPGAGVSQENVLHTLAHEATHAATAEKINENPMIARALNSIAQDAQESDAVKSLSEQDRYGAKLAGTRNGAHEFATEAHVNPRFQEALRNTPSKHGSGTLWDDYKGVVAHILKPGSAAAAVALAANPLFDKLLSANSEGEKPGA